MVASLLCAMLVPAWQVPAPLPAPSALVERRPIAVQQPQTSSELLFPGTSTLAALQPDWLGAPAANKYNPGGAGNAEGAKCPYKTRRHPR